MRMLNQATEDADAFLKMLQKAAGSHSQEKVVVLATAEVREWNAEVERKKAEKRTAKGKHR